MEEKHVAQRPGLARVPLEGSRAPRSCWASESSALEPGAGWRPRVRRDAVTRYITSTNRLVALERRRWRPTAMVAR